MCTGKIVKIWVQDEPMDADKATTMSEWSVNLYELAGKGWQVARPKLICMGGGNGFYEIEGKGTKSIKDVWGMDGSIVKHAHISGWHGHESAAAAESAGYSKAWTLFKVQFRGLMQRSSQGELVASEMRVIEVIN